MAAGVCLILIGVLMASRVWAVDRASPSAAETSPASAQAEVMAGPFGQPAPFDPAAAERAVAQAWESARDAGIYSFATQLSQVTYPAHTLSNLGRAIAAFTPEGGIVVNESGTTGLAWSTAHAWSAAPHTMLGLTGGAIGQGLPVALGAALACPDRRSIAFHADGCGLYTLQALWSMARESTDLTVVVCANRRYRVLQIELARAGIAAPRPEVQALTDLTQPVIDWIALAKGFGLPACGVSTDDELAGALRRALSEPVPSPIEAVIA